tara:strand:- start:1270 stop:2205 length:936 start_codon:yes stop_codon:yes gene_type:complete
MRSATFMLADRAGLSPSNVDQGYIIRRLIRRAIRHGRMIGIEDAFTVDLAEVVISEYSEAYPELSENKEHVISCLQTEEDKFSKTIKRGLKEFEKMIAKHELSGEHAFHLFSTYGFPLELTIELAREKGQMVDHKVFDEEFKKHQELSRAGAGQKFAGGLADSDPKTIMGHTATHLLHAALREVLGDHVEQKGSNITAKRLRFDFSHPDKLTDDEKARVEAIVNENIEKNIPVQFEMLSVEEAKERGAIGLFDDAYAQIGDKIKVYFVGDASKEICGGPHVVSTGEIKSFKIIKEESSSQGIRRIKAVVGN